MDWLGYQTVMNYGVFPLYDLKLNHALVIANTSLKDIGVYVKENDCVDCPFTLLHKLDNENHWQVNTSVSTIWRVMKTDDFKYYSRKSQRGLICQLSPELGEFGVYRLNVGLCELKEEIPPVNSYLPLILLLSTLMLMGIFFMFTRYLYKYVIRSSFRKDEGQERENKIIKPDYTDSCLNVLRGFYMILIIFLTSGAGGYTVLTKEYSGVSIADCVLFSFIWTVGFNIPLAMSKIMDSDLSKLQLFSRIAKNSASLTLIGVTIESTISRCLTENFALWCPLQKIGVAYFIASCAYIFTAKTYFTKSKRLIKRMIVNFLSLIWCWIIGSMILSVLFVLLTTLWSFNYQPNDNYIVKPTKLITRSNNIEDLSTDRIDDITQYLNLFLVAKKDIVYVHQYFGFTKGIMGILSSTLYSLIGLKGGLVYQTYKCHRKRVTLWTIWGAVFMLIGLLFVGISYAVKFNLWPMASILLIASLSYFAFIALYSFTEKFQPSFETAKSFGITFLLILTGHMLFSTSFPFYLGITFRNHLFYLLQNLWIILIWFLVSSVVYKRGVEFFV